MVVDQNGRSQPDQEPLEEQRTQPAGPGAVRTDDEGSGAEKGSRRVRPKRGGGARQVARVARVLRDRDDHVAKSLTMMGRLGLLDEEAQKRLWSLYREGDEATRRLVKEQVGRVVGRRGEVSGESRPNGRQAGDEPVEPGSVDPLELEVLRGLSSKQVDVATVARQIRRFDPGRVLGDPKAPGPVLRFFSWAPLALHRFQRSLVVLGVVLLLLVAALVAVAVFQPAALMWVLFGGVVFCAFVAGVLLLRWGFWVDRTAKRQGFDLDVYAKLPDDERRVLVLRRLSLRFWDPQRLAQLVERGLGRAVPGEGPPGSDARQPEAVATGAPDAAPSIDDSIGPSKQAEPADLGDLGEPVASAPAASSGRAAAAVDGRGEDDRHRDDRREGDPDGRGGARMARFLDAAQKAVRQAAGSPTAKRVRQEMRERARDAREVARERWHDVRERGHDEIRRRKEVAGKRPARTAPAKAGRNATGGSNRRPVRKSGAGKSAGKKRAAKAPSRKTVKRGSGGEGAARKTKGVKKRTAANKVAAKRAVGQKPGGKRPTGKRAAKKRAVKKRATQKRAAKKRAAKKRAPAKGAPKRPAAKKRARKRS